MSTRRYQTVEIAELRQLAHVLAIARAEVRARDHGSLGVVEAAVAGADLEAGGEPLDVPFPRRGEGLVEVVDVHDHASGRRGEPAEVREVRVAARLNP